MSTPNMEEVNDSLSSFKPQWEDLPHSRKKLSKHYGKPGMDNIRVIRAALSKRSNNLK